MASNILDGKACAADLEEKLKERIDNSKVQPHLAVIIVGDDPASHVYVRNKILSCERLGIKSTHISFPEDTRQDVIAEKIHSLNVVRTAFEIINLKTGKNPVEILVRAVENSAPNEDTTRIVYGGTVYHVSVDVAPLRRVDLALRFIADGVKEATFSNPKPIEEYLAEHLILSANNDTTSPSIKKKNELERVAQASR